MSIGRITVTFRDTADGYHVYTSPAMQLWPHSTDRVMQAVQEAKKAGAAVYKEEESYSYPGGYGLWVYELDAEVLRDLLKQS